MKIYVNNNVWKSWFIKILVLFSYAEISHIKAVKCDAYLCVDTSIWCSYTNRSEYVCQRVWNNKRKQVLETGLPICRYIVCNRGATVLPNSYLLFVCSLFIVTTRDSVSIKLGHVKNVCLTCLHQRAMVHAQHNTYIDIWVFLYTCLCESTRQKVLWIYFSSFSCIYIFFILLLKRWKSTSNKMAKENKHTAYISDEPILEIGRECTQMCCHYK